MITINEADRLWDAVDQLAASAEGVKMSAIKGWELTPPRTRNLTAAARRVAAAVDAVLPTLALEDLDALPEGTVIVEAHGLAKQKNRGRWRAWFDKHGSSSQLMLDPDHSAQPLTVAWVPES